MKMNSNYKVFPMPDDLSASAMGSLCVRGSGFSNRRCRSSTGGSSKAQECETTVRRTVSFIDTKQSERYYCAEKTQNLKKAGKIIRSSKSAKVSATESSIYNISKRNELKRSKSEASLKVNTRISVEKQPIASDSGSNAKRRQSSALKRKESFTRGDIISDQNENAIDSVKRKSKFKLDIKVGVRNDHYNQWARRKKSDLQSISANVIRGDQSSRTSPPSPTRGLEIQPSRSLSIPRKGSALKRGIKYLNFENFNTIFNDIPADKQRIPTTMKLGSREVIQAGNNMNSLKESDGTKDTGNASSENSRREKKMPIPRISVDNVLIKESENDKNIKANNKFRTKEKESSPRVIKKDSSVSENATVNTNVNSEQRNKAPTTETDVERRNKTADTETDAERRNKTDNIETEHTNKTENSEIDAVYQANSSLYLQLPKHSVKSHDCSSDDEFDKTPIIDGKTVSEAKNQNKDVILSTYLGKTDKNTKSKIQYSPVKQDILSSFEIKTDQPLRIIIKDSFYRLSRETESLQEAKERVTSAITRNKQSITMALDKGDKLPKKMPLKLATKSPILVTQSLESGFAHMRIEQHLQNLKLRVESQNSARRSPIRFNDHDRESVPPSRDGRSRNGNENRYKQTCISINDQVSFAPKHSIGLINHSATNCYKQRNKLGEILPFGRLSTG